MFKRIKQVHFVGIGGIGMSGIAEVLLNLGYKVTGSDIRATSITDRLQQLGAVVYLRHAAENVKGAHVVVTSSAVHSDNPEIEEAQRRKIPVIARAEMLAELARLKYAITVAGTHGKTTTTSMIATILDRAGYDPTVVVGGLLNTIGSNARLGKGDYIVLEADVEPSNDVECGCQIASGLHRVTHRAGKEANGPHGRHCGGRLRHVSGSKHRDTGRVERDQFKPAPVGNDLGNRTTQ